MSSGPSLGGEAARLQASRDELEAVLRGVADGVTVQSPDGRLLFANEAAARLIGFPSPEALLSASPAEVIAAFEVLDEHGATIPLEDLPNRRALRGESVPPTAVRFRVRASGEERWTMLASTAVRGPDGSVQMLTNVFHDVTEQQRNARRLRLLAETGALLSSTLDPEAALAGAVALMVPSQADYCIADLVDDDGTIRRVAAASADPANEPLARALRERFWPDPSRPEGVAKVVRTGLPELLTEVSDAWLQDVARDAGHLAVLRALRPRSYMIVPLRARGRAVGALTLIATESRQLYGPDDLALAEELAGRAAFVIDNARLFEAERQAREDAESARRWLDDLLEGTPANIYVKDPAGRYLAVNRSYETSTGMGRESVLGKTDFDVFPPQLAERYRANDLRVLESGEPMQFEEVAEERDGRRTYVAVKFPLRDADGRPAAVCGISMDITPLAEAQREKEEFMASVAHDLASPLTAIRGLAEMLLRRAERADTLEPSALVGGLQQIGSSAARMAEQIRDLLDTARLRAGEGLELRRAPTDLVDVAREAVEVCQQTTEHHSLRLEIADSSLIGHWDGPRLRRVVENLVGNAIKFSPEGGDIAVAVAHEQAGGLAWGVLRVQDHGLGIPTSEIGRVFDRYFRGSNVTGRTDGSGIGLSGAKTIVHQHGGTLTAESAGEGLGSTFTLRLPLSKPQHRNGEDG